MKKIHYYLNPSFARWFIRYPVYPDSTTRKLLENPKAKQQMNYKKSDSNTASILGPFYQLESGSTLHSTSFFLVLCTSFLITDITLTWLKSRSLSILLHSHHDHP